MLSARHKRIVVLLALAAFWGCSRASNDGSTQPKKLEKQVEHSKVTRFGPTVAGSFYTSDPDELRRSVSTFLDRGKTLLPKLSGSLLGIIAPHAGYRFSGRIAGVGYASAQGHDIDTVVILGPSHHVSRRHACILDVDEYVTPLGAVAIDQEMVQRLVQRSDGLVQVDPAAFSPEHSLDVQIPFVQTALPKARIVPIIVPWMPVQRFHELAALLNRAIARDAKVLLVASSDLSHFFPIERGKEIDAEILDELRRGDEASLLQGHDQRRGPCGIAPIVVLLEYAKLRTNKHFSVHVLASETSGDVVPSTASRVVGYGALAVTADATNAH